MLCASWQTPLYASSWPVTAGAQLHSGQRNGLVVFAPASTVRKNVKSGINSVLVFISVSGPWGWRNDVQTLKLWRLSSAGSGRLLVMNGDHAGGLELGKVEAKFILHASKCRRGQAVASDMVGVDGWKL